MAEFDMESQPQLPDYDTFNRIKDQWSAFSGSPGGQAAMLQFGLNLLAGPTTFGQSFGSQVAGAVGGAGEAVGRQEAMNIKQQEAASKEELRTAQAGAAGARAGTEGARLDLARERLQQQKETSLLQQRVKYALGYNNYIRPLQTENARLMQKYNADKNIFPDTPAPTLHKIPTPDEYIAQQESLSGGLYGPGQTPGAPRVGEQQGSQLDAARAWLEANPNSPDAPAVRQKIKDLGG